VWPAQRWARQAALALQAALRPSAELDAMVRPQGAARAAVAPRAVQGAAEAVRPAERVCAAAQRQEAAAVWVGAARRQEARDAAEVLQRAARDAAEVLQRAAPGAPVAALPSAGLPSVATWVFHRDRLRRRGLPAPSPSVRFARAMAR
jgi:hypothetical protein